MSTASIASPYAVAPGRVALAYTEGRAAGGTEDPAPVCPYDLHLHGNEARAWQRGFDLARLIDRA